MALLKEALPVNESLPCRAHAEVLRDFPRATLGFRPTKLS